MQSFGKGDGCGAGGYVSLQHERRCSLQARAQRFQRAADSCRAHPRITAAAAAPFSTAHASHTSYPTHSPSPPGHALRPENRTPPGGNSTSTSLIDVGERNPSPGASNPNPTLSHTGRQTDGCLRGCGPQPRGTLASTASAAPQPCRRQARGARFQPVAGVYHRLPQVRIRIP